MGRDGHWILGPAWRRPCPGNTGAGYHLPECRFHAFRVRRSAGRAGGDGGALCFSIRGECCCASAIGTALPSDENGRCRLVPAIEIAAANFRTGGKDGRGENSIG